MLALEQLPESVLVVAMGKWAEVWVVVLSGTVTLLGRTSAGMALWEGASVLELLAAEKWFPAAAWGLTP